LEIKRKINRVAPAGAATDGCALKDSCFNRGIAMKTRFLLTTVSFIALQAFGAPAFAQTPDLFADVAATYGLRSDQLSQSTRNAIDDVRVFNLQSQGTNKLEDAQQQLDDARKMVALKSPGAADALSFATKQLNSINQTYNDTLTRVTNGVNADIAAAQSTPSFAITKATDFSTNQVYVNAAAAVRNIDGGSLVVAAESLVAAGGGNLTLAQRTELGRLVAAGGGNIVSAGGGNIVSAGGGNLDAVGKAEIALLVAAGGGNVSADAMAKVSTLVAAGGGNLVAAGGGNIVAAGGGNLVAAGGGNLVAAGGGNILNFDANQNAKLVAAGGGNIVDVVATARVISNDGGSIMRAAVALVSAGGGNLTADQLKEVNRLVAAGGGNLLSTASGSLVGPSGGTLTVMDKAALAALVSAGGGNIVSAGGGNIVSAGGGNIVSAGGGNLIAVAALKLVSAGGGNLGAATQAALTITSSAELTNLQKMTGSTAQLAQGGSITLAQIANPQELKGTGIGNFDISKMRNSNYMGSTSSSTPAAPTAIQQFVNAATQARDGAATDLSAAKAQQADIINKINADPKLSAKAKADAIKVAMVGTGLSIGQLQTKLDKANADLTAALKPTVAPTADQQKAATAAATLASNNASVATGRVGSDRLALDAAIKTGNQPAIATAQATLAKDSAAATAAIAILGSKIDDVRNSGAKTPVGQDATGKDVAFTDGSYKFVDAKANLEKQLAASPVQSAAGAAAAGAVAKAQDTAASSQAAANAADAAYKAATAGGTIIRPADFINRVGGDIAGLDKGVADLKAKSDATQARLTAANNNPNMSRDDLIALRAQAVVDSKAYFYLKDKADSGYAEKYARANAADADLASARSARDTLTNLASKTTDPAQLATLNSGIATATIVQTAAQAKSDQLNADSQIVYLQAANRDGAGVTDAQKDKNRVEIARLQDVSKTSQAALAAIADSNRPNVAVQAIAANNYVGLKSDNFVGLGSDRAKLVGTKLVPAPIVQVPIETSLRNNVVVPALMQLDSAAHTAANDANVALSNATKIANQFTTNSPPTPNTIMGPVAANPAPGPQAPPAGTSAGLLPAPPTGNMRITDGNALLRPDTPVTAGGGVAAVLDNNIRQATLLIDSKSKEVDLLKAKLVNASVGDRARINADIATANGVIANIQKARDADSKQSADLKATAATAPNPRPVAPVTTVTASPPSTAVAPTTAAGAPSAELVAKFIAATIPAGTDPDGALAKKLLSKVSPELMRQSVDVTLGKGGLSAAAGAELSMAAQEAQAELAKEKSASAKPGTPVAGVVVANAQPGASVGGTAPSISKPAEPPTLTTIPKEHITLIDTLLRSVPDTKLSQPQKEAVSRLSDIAASGHKPLNMDAQQLARFEDDLATFKKIHPGAVAKLEPVLAAISAKKSAFVVAAPSGAAPTADASPGGNAVPGSKEALQRDLSLRERDGGARKADYFPPQVPASEKGKLNEAIEKKIEAKITPTATSSPAGNTAPAGAADKAKIPETRQITIVTPDKPLPLAKAAVEPAHPQKLQQPVQPVAAARSAVQGPPKIVAPVAAQKSATIAAPVNKPPPAPMPTPQPHH
jgi:hypothetical protein